MREIESTTETGSVSFSEEFLDAAPDAIVVVDPHGAIRVVNQQAVELFGHDRDELLRRSIDDLVPAAFRPGHAAQRRSYHDAPRIRQMADPHSQVSALRADGSLVPVEIALSPVAVDGNRYVMAIVRNVTDKVRAGREKTVMRQRLAVVEDRDRIARDLHDLVIQRLFAVGMRLQSALNDPERLRERAGGTINELDETISVIRDAIFHLTHSNAALTTQIRSLVDRHDASVQCSIALDVDERIDTLPPELGEQLLPTINEALANVVRHARAESVSVSITVSSGQTLELRVIDDGVGFDASSPPGFGLNNLRDRAAQLGGAMRISRIADGGTDLVWRVPVRSLG